MPTDRLPAVVVPQGTGSNSMDEDAMDYEMQRHGPHPHVGPRVGGGCPALAGWRGEQYRSFWQEHRGWSQQHYFPPVSSDPFLQPHHQHQHHPHPPSFSQHWTHGANNTTNNTATNTTTTTNSTHAPHLGLPASRPADLHYESSFTHQIPEFSPLPPLSAHQPYAPVTFVPPAPRPTQRSPQIPQGPGDFQHILHSNQASPVPTTGPVEGGVQQHSESQPAPRGPNPPASASPSESSNTASTHDTEANMPSHPSHNPQSRASGHGFPSSHQDVNMQPHARLPPPTPNPRVLPQDSAARRASVAAYVSREAFASSASAFAGLRSRPGVVSNDGNSDTPASPGSSLDEDSDPDEAAPRFHYTGLRSVRQAQLLRGQMSNKRVASQKAIKALQNVEIDSLPENERTCVICYNDFGVASPEGINEHPLRLPKCKHVFGNHCILKWFEDADSCPYCRDKLHSEPAPPSRDMLRRTYQVARGDPELGMPAYRRAIQALRRDSSGVDMYHQYAMYPRGVQPHNEGSHRDASAAGERRAPPEDPSDTQRRQRPRHDPSMAYDRRHGGMLAHAVSEQRYDPSNTTSQQQHSPVRQPFSPSSLSLDPQQPSHPHDIWPQETQNISNLQQLIYQRASNTAQPIFARASNMPHQAQAANHPATLAPLGPNSSGLAGYVPSSPPASSLIGSYPRTLSHAGNYQNYSGPLGGGGLQAPTSAELPPPTSFPAPPQPPSAFTQQLPHLNQFRNPAYTPFNLGLEYTRADAAVSLGNNGFYAPN